MAKTAKLKKKTSSLRSRAAKRASSPSLNVDKSLKNAKPPDAIPPRPSILAIHQAAGVTKKSKKPKQISSKQRKRLVEGVRRAEHVGDKLEKKIERSRGKEQNVKDRRVAWEAANERNILGKDSVLVSKEDLLAR